MEQIDRVRNMGTLSQLINMLPGLGQIKQQLDVEELDDSYFRQFQAIVSSMTPEERRKPEIIRGSRRRRIANGSGTSPQEVSQLLNQFKEAKKLMKALAGGKMPAGLAGAARR